MPRQDTARTLQRHEQPPAARPPVVLVHGLKGSFLRDGATGALRYPTLRQLLRLQDDQLPLPLSREPGKDGLQRSDGLEPAGPLDEMKATCFTLATFYGPLLHALDKERGSCTFSYDWRREPSESSARLEQFLEEVGRDSPTSNVQVICHSMGGLITFPLLNRRPELFHSVLFAASALGRGSASFLPDMSEPKGGNMLGPFNSTMLTPRLWVSWPAPWFFLPLKEHPTTLSGISHLQEADGTPVPVDFHSLEDWKRLRIGPYHPRSDVPPEWLADVATESFLRETLARARAWRLKMVCDPAVRYPPIAVLRSSAKPTPEGIKRPSPDEPFDFGESATTEGDGRVSLNGAMPPEGVPVLKVVTIQARHDLVLNDVPLVLGLLQDLVEEAESRSAS